MLKNSMISQHFSYGELTKTNVNAVNTPDDEQLQNMKLLCNNILEPIREKFGIVIINSCFRSKAVNDKVGGADNSQHLEGKAADVKAVDGITLSELMQWVKNNLAYDQMIGEKCVNGEPRWLHISFNEGKNRKQIMYT